MDWLARRAATLVARDDLDVEAARVAAVLCVDHVGEAGIRFDIEDHVAVGPELHGCIGDDPLEGGARTEHLQPIFVLHPGVRVSLAGAATDGVRVSYSERTLWRARQTVAAAWKRGGEEKHKAEPE